MFLALKKLGVYEVVSETRCFAIWISNTSMEYTSQLGFNRSLGFSQLCYAGKSAASLDVYQFKAVSLKKAVGRVRSFITHVGILHSADCVGCSCSLNFAVGKGLDELLSYDGYN